MFSCPFTEHHLCEAPSLMQHFLSTSYVLCMWCKCDYAGRVECIQGHQECRMCPDFTGGQEELAKFLINGDI